MHFTKKLKLLTVDDIKAQRSRESLPPWLKMNLGGGGNFTHVKGLLVDQQLHTVCRSAKCPNLGECWSEGTATFMILGDQCTRSCPFCAIEHSKPQAPDSDEPRRLAYAAKEMKLRWVVLTSVTRDDLPDGGAHHFLMTIKALRNALPDSGIETLVPDFRKKHAALDILLQSPPDVLNHNIETVPRLYRKVRPGAIYELSLQLLRDFTDAGLVTKAGMFLGVGENIDEVHEVFSDMRQAGVRSLTVSQYLRPSPQHLPVERYVHPDEFAELETVAIDMGFEHVASGPLVRSSYRAAEAAEIYGLRGGKIDAPLMIDAASQPELH